MLAEDLCKRLLSRHAALGLLTNDTHDHTKLGKLTELGGKDWTGMTLKDVAQSISKALVLLTQKRCCDFAGTQLMASLCQGLLLELDAAVYHPVRFGQQQDNQSDARHDEQSLSIQSLRWVSPSTPPLHIFKQAQALLTATVGVAPMLRQ